MPLTLMLTEGVVPKGQEKAVFARLSEALLRAHGLTGNPVMTRNVVGTLHVLPADAAFVGMEATPAAFVEWKVPAFALADAEVQQRYFAEAADIVHEASGGRLPRDRIFINVVHAVDGAWNFDGKRMTNAEIGAAVARG